MKRIAVVGGGVSGLTVACKLGATGFGVTVFEKEDTAGGLIRCKKIDGSLFHICGGHVFNTKNQEVLNWFWSKFDRERDFVKADRHSAVCLQDGKFVDYPIENHVYQLDAETQRHFYEDVHAMMERGVDAPANFDEFLRGRFGETLYNLYFRPYNLKVWRRDLRKVPLSWLEGKLPMPTPREMLDANKTHLEEKSFVHSTFYYEKQGGSQFIADTLAKNLNVKYNADVVAIKKESCGVSVCLADGTQERFDALVFCGNIKELPRMLQGIEFGDLAFEIERLESHGTTAVFCETDPIPYSWFYQPSPHHQSHRFICTGNFSSTNNAPGKMTCTVEFTDEIDVAEIKAQLEKMPYHPKYLTHRYHKYTYPIQHKNTREMIHGVKSLLARNKVFLCGRFAEWEYFNMDAAMASALKLNLDLLNRGGGDGRMHNYKS